MRASRLLLMLLLLQNRGRMTAAQLATELDVSRRTVLRDIEALGEAGLPVVVHRGPRGGVELGFSYRTRLTGLATDEAEALGVVLSAPVPELAELGLSEAAARARTKLVESLPDPVRATVQRSQDRVRFVDGVPRRPRPEGGGARRGDPVSPGHAARRPVEVTGDGAPGAAAAGRRGLGRGRRALTECRCAAT